MEWVETTGATLHDAVDRALDQLGVDERDLEYEVLAEPRTGLFGRLKGEARIRARVKPLSREKPQQGRSRGRARPEGRERRRTPDRTEATGDQEGTRPAREGRTRSRRRRLSRSGTRSGNVEGTNEAKHQGTNEGKTVDDQITVDEQAEMAVEFARGLVEAFGAEAEVASTLEDDENVLVEITGDDLGLLVGPKGATLAAVEELVRTVVQRGTAGGSARIHVDIGGYRAKRRAALAEFATKVATSALETDTTKALEPMSAADRKVVHDTVAEIDGVETTSEGDEPQRRVVIRRV